MSVSCAPQHHFFFRRSHAGQMLLFALAILDSANSANWGSERAKMGVSCAPQHHFFSAFSCRRNATFCPCNPGFCPFWFSPFDVFSLQTLCFFERARRFAATDGNPLFFRASATFSCLCRKTIVFFSGERNVFSSPWSSFLFRGRRQLPQAGEVRRPPGAAW